MIKLGDDYIDLIDNFGEFCRFVHFDKVLDMDIYSMNDFIRSLGENDWDYQVFDPEYLRNLCEQNSLLFSLIYAFSKYKKN